MKPVLAKTLDGKAREIAIDVDRLVESRLLVQGTSGSGKSHAVRRLLEQVDGLVQAFVIDVEGEYVTLREKFAYALAGPGGECAADVRSAARLPRVLLESRASCVVDLSDMEARKRPEFVRLFLEGLMASPRSLDRDLLVVVEEAQLFAPQSGRESEATEAIEDLAARGRKRGHCLVAVTQRVSDLSKSVVAQCGNRLIGKTTLDTDVKRAAYEIGFDGRQDARRLVELERGQFFAWGPALSDEVVFCQAYDTQTRPPKHRSAGGAKAPPPTPDALRQVLAPLASLPQEAEHELRSLEEAKARIRALEREVKAKPAPPAPVAPSKPVVQRVEVPILEDSQVKRLEAQMEKLQKISAEHDAQIEVVAGHVAALAGAISMAIRHAKGGPVGETSKSYSRIIRPKAAVPAQPEGPRATTTVASEPAEGLSRPQQGILDAAALLESRGLGSDDAARLALWSGFLPGGSNWRANVGRLRALGLITGTTLTEEGRALAKPPEISTDDDLHRMVRERFLTEPQRKILDELLAAYPSPVDADELAEKTGFQPGGSNWRANIGRLRRFGLATKSSPIAATPQLFLEGAA